MGRKKWKKPADDYGCAHCGVNVSHNAPMEGLVYEWNGKLEAICSNCGTKVAKLFQIINQRWG